jgi:hypothetical protein
VGYFEHIRKGFFIANRNPGLIAMRLVLGFALPALIFILLYLPVLASFRDAVEALFSTDGLRRALERPDDALSMLMAPALYSYAVFLAFLLVLMIGNTFSEARTLRALSLSLGGNGRGLHAGVKPGALRGTYRSLMSYSFLCSVALLMLLSVFVALGAIVAVLVSSLPSGGGVLLQTMLLVAYGGALVLSLLCLYSIRLWGLAFMYMDGLRATEALFRAARLLWRKPALMNEAVCMLGAYVLLQPLMALSLWGLLNVPEAGMAPAALFCLVWLVLDIYLGLLLKAAVFAANHDIIQSASPVRDAVTLDEAAGILEEEEASSPRDPDVWGHFEQAEDSEDMGRG